MTFEFGSSTSQSININVLKKTTSRYGRIHHLSTSFELIHKWNTQKHIVTGTKIHMYSSEITPYSSCLLELLNRTSKSININASLIIAVVNLLHVCIATRAAASEGVTGLYLAPPWHTACTRRPQLQPSHRIRHHLRWWWPCCMQGTKDHRQVKGCLREMMVERGRDAGQKSRGWQGSSPPQPQAQDCEVISNIRQKPAMFNVYVVLKARRNSNRRCAQ